MKPEAIIFKPCPKTFTSDLDKAIPPEETLKEVQAALDNCGLDILAEAKRIDNGRLGIPVYMGICGADALATLPTRKQMGKGASPSQAKASAIMELMERYAFFSFFSRSDNFVKASWSQARQIFGKDLIPLEQIALSAGDADLQNAAKILDLVEWRFYPATDVLTGQIVWLPLDWFRMLGEFNGSSAGNTNEESVLQGICELVERHVCCILDRERPITPTIDPASCKDPILAELIGKFKKQGIKLLLKDISLGMPIPTVAALAWDPATFPQKSEIVFTAGTATSPEKAAIRAITEVAQLGGDFCANSCYEASGLPKFQSLAEAEWLHSGDTVALDTLPNLERPDIHTELLDLAQRLSPLKIYAIQTTNSAIGIPAHYCVIPGLKFREKDPNASLGLFAGRKLAEEAPPDQAAAGLDALESIYPKAHYLPFFRGLLALRRGDPKAADFFADSIGRQPDDESRALAAFYCGYAHTQANDWSSALPHLQAAASLAPDMKEYVNLLGVAYFRLGDYETAEGLFDRAIKIDKGSAMDLANRGICRKYQHKYEAAREDLAIALELDPSLEFARDALAEIDSRD